MAQIKKKCWPEWFEKFQSGERTMEVRLADFSLREGDELVMQEYDPKTKQYSGRELSFVCSRVEKTTPLTFYTLDDLQKYGMYIVDLQKK